MSTGYGHSQHPHLNSISKLLFHSLSHDHSQSSSSEKQIELQPESDANLTRPALAPPTYQHVHTWKNQVASRLSSSPIKIEKLSSPLLPLKTQLPCSSTTPKVAPESTLVPAQGYKLMIQHWWSPEAVMHLPGTLTIL